MAIPFMNVMLDGWWQLTKCNLQRVLRIPPPPPTPYTETLRHRKGKTLFGVPSFSRFTISCALRVGEVVLTAKLRYPSLSVFWKDLCSDLQLRLPAVKGAASHFTPCSNENSISVEPLFQSETKRTPFSSSCQNETSACRWPCVCSLGLSLSRDTGYQSQSTLIFQKQ